MFANIRFTQCALMIDELPQLHIPTIAINSQIPVT